MKKIILIFCLVSFSPFFVFAESSQLWTEAIGDNSTVKMNIPSFAPIIEELSKTVVNISIEGKEQVDLGIFAPDGGLGGQPRTPFDFFFRELPQGSGGKRSFSSLGSGFVINADGYIVTNYHVVEKATKISVSFRDDEKKTFSAKVVGADKKSDVALLKIETKEKLPAVLLGDSDSLRPGDWVIAIGNPFRLGHTATVGIVSATSRKLDSAGPYSDYIQTDASINPGNSGGPLFNAQGQVVGINTAIFSPGRAGGSGFNIGIGFATPINVAKDIINQLGSNGKVTRGWLGVLIQSISPDAAEALKLEEANGALVADVIENSPAADAGIKRGDVIVKYDGKSVRENDELPLLVAKSRIGKEVEIEAIRQGNFKKFRVTIKELKEDSEVQTAQEDGEDQLGLTLQELSPDIAKALNVEDNAGVVVASVAPDSVGEKSGVRRGDIILEVGGELVESVADFRRYLKKVKVGKPLLLLIRREGNTVFLTLKLEK